jgi:hypothetical protein
MPTIPLPLSAVERIHAIWLAASDRDLSSPSLSGVLIKGSADCIAIAATDGKILVEEAWTLDAGTLEAEWILSAASALMLRDWCKAVRKSLGKRADATVQMICEQRQITVGMPGSPIGDIKLACVDATFPQYAKALDNPTLPEHGPARIGMNLQYLSALETLWKVKGQMGPCVTCEFHRGMIFRPLSGPPVGCQRQIALVMPITLPT